MSSQNDKFRIELSEDRGMIYCHNGEIASPDGEVEVAVTLSDGKREIVTIKAEIIWEQVDGGSVPKVRLEKV